MALFMSLPCHRSPVRSPFMLQSASDGEDSPAESKRCLKYGIALVAGCCLVAGAAFLSQKVHLQSRDELNRVVDVYWPYLSGSIDAGAAEKEHAIAGCHDISKSEGHECMKEVILARRRGAIPHAARLTGGLGGLRLPNHSSPLTEWQELVYKTSRGLCPRPCSMRTPIFCDAQPAPAMWQPARHNETIHVKVLTYNLYWWNLFLNHDGMYKDKSGRVIRHSAGKLIAHSLSPPYDVMGFQECEDIKQVLEPVGLLKQYEAFQGNHAMCMAYRTGSWSLLQRGEADVAEDQATEYYGLRGAQWMRLRHVVTGQTLFFMNHHGPLHVNSGGECGGVSTARNLLHLIADNAEKGDAVVLVGDFNANADSLTIQELWKHLVLLYNGDSFGGVDNIFSNIAASSIVNTSRVGSAGSDHDAVSVTFSWDSAATAIRGGAGNLAAEEAVKDSLSSQCGLLETGIEYVFREGVWTHHLYGVESPRQCCTLCARVTKCKAWVMADWVPSARGPSCTLKGGDVVSKRPKDGVMSGLPTKEASAAAHRAALTAKLSV